MNKLYQIQNLNKLIILTHNDMNKLNNYKLTEITFT